MTAHKQQRPTLLSQLSELASRPDETKGRRGMLPSPLRYPGGKLWLVDYIEHVLEVNALRPSLFVEPFAGGASVALSLLARDRVESIGLVDRDPLVAAFWDTVFHDAEWLVEQIRTVDVTLERWHGYKAAIPDDRRERALACLFLNRTSYSGILTRRTGPIGGQAQTSRYAIDCRFPRGTLIERIERLAARADRVAFVLHNSWEEGLAHVSSLINTGANKLASKDVFYYIDPPFFRKAERLYTYYFRDADHRRLRDSLIGLEERWVLSYDACDDVEDLYRGVGNKLYFDLPYSTARARAERRELKAEAIITHQAVALPPDGQKHPDIPGLQSVRRPASRQDDSAVPVVNAASAMGQRPAEQSASVDGAESRTDAHGCSGATS